MSEPLTIEINGQPVTASMDEWRKVRQAITERVVADRKVWEQQRRDAGQVWYALYWYHHSERVAECFSREEAEAVMERDDQASVGIVNPDGSFDPQAFYSQDSLRHFTDVLDELRGESA